MPGGAVANIQHQLTMSLMEGAEGPATTVTNPSGGFDFLHPETFGIQPNRNVFNNCGRGLAKSTFKEIIATSPVQRRQDEAFLGPSSQI